MIELLRKVNVGHTVLTQWSIPRADLSLSMDQFSNEVIRPALFKLEVA